MEQNNEAAIAVNFHEKLCGYVMPISDTAEYKSGHWGDVLEILNQVCKDIGFKEFRVVSSGHDVTTIHKRIVNNLYNDDIIICDVSSRNPNVMFELGMRIAFDKPVVIIKDDITPYCFDAGTIEHIEYPKDLRYVTIETFKKKLKSKIEKTLTTFLEKPEQSPILKSFGDFEASKINIPVMSDTEKLVSAIEDMRSMMLKTMHRNEPYKLLVSRDNIDMPIEQIRILASRNQIAVKIISKELIELSGDSEANVLEFMEYLYNRSSRMRSTNNVSNITLE